MALNLLPTTPTLDPDVPEPIPAAPDYELQPHVLVARNQSVHLVGPFASMEQAKEWGWENQGYDARWQPLSLPVSTLHGAGRRFHAVPVHSPAAALTEVPDDT